MPIVIERADGGVSVLRLIGGADPAAEVAKWVQSAVPEWLPVVTWAETSEESLPPDRQYRAAWKFSGEAVEPDASQAAAIAREAAIRAIDAQCQAAIAQGFQFAGKTFSLSVNAQTSLNAIFSAAIAGVLPIPQGMTAIDETEHVLQTIDQVKLFCLTAFGVVVAAKNAARAAKAALPG